MNQPPTAGAGIKHVALFESQSDHAELIAHCLQREIPGVEVHLADSAQAFRVDAALVSTNTDPHHALPLIEKSVTDRAKLVLMRGAVERWSASERARLRAHIELNKREGARFLRKLVRTVRAHGEQTADSSLLHLAAADAPRSASPGGGASAPLVDICGLLLADLEQSVARLTHVSATSRHHALDEEARCRAILGRLRSVLGTSGSFEPAVVKMCGWLQLRRQAWRSRYPWLVVEYKGRGTPPTPFSPMALGACLDRWMAHLAPRVPTVDLAVEQVSHGVLPLRLDLASPALVRMRMSTRHRALFDQRELVDLTMAVVKATGGYVSVADEADRLDMLFPVSSTRPGEPIVGRDGAPSLLAVGLELPLGDRHCLSDVGWRAMSCDPVQAHALVRAGCRYRLVLVDGQQAPAERDALIREIRTVETNAGIVLASVDGRIRAANSAVEAGAWGVLASRFNDEAAAQLVCDLFGETKVGSTISPRPNR